MGKQEVKTRSGERVAVVAGLRTPFARQSTEFSQVPAVDLGKMVVSEMLARTDKRAQTIATTMNSSANFFHKFSTAALISVERS